MKEDYFESDEFKELLNNYEETKEQGYPRYLDEDDYADISDYYMNKGNAKEAMECAEEGLSTHPDSVLMQSVKCGLLIFYHRYSEAREILDSIPEETRNLDIFYQRAQLVYALDGNADYAEELFREWIELQKTEDNKRGDKSDESTRDLYIHVITSFIELTENHQYDEELVKRWIEEYLVIFPSIGICNADTILSEIVRDERMFDMVEKVYKKILETDPYLNCGYTVLATAQNILGKTSESIESCNFALAIDPKDWEAKSILAHNTFIQGDYEKALVLIEDVNNELGDNSQSLLYSKCLCMCNRDMECCEQLKNAEEYAENFKVNLPDFYAEIYAEVSELYMMCDRYQESLIAIDKALAIYPNDQYYLMGKGILYAKMGKDKEDVAEYIRRCIDDSNNRIDTAIGVGIRLIISGCISYAYDYLVEAQQYVAETEEDRQRQRIIPAYLAMIHYKEKSLDDFMNQIKIACSQCPDVVANVFAEIIPQNIAPNDFYDYLINKIRDITNCVEDGNKQ